MKLTINEHTYHNISEEAVIFLIGGYDLEMFEIISILKEGKFKFLDEKLKWGAKLSSYKTKIESLKKEKRWIVGIELIDDLNLKNTYGRYVEIDHHNENEDLPPSIIQIAKIINHSLTRDQELIAANDKGFIKAMEEAGATQKEIKNIRERDRRQQGITEEDEKLAIKDIEKGELIHAGSSSEYFLVKSSSPKFSAITDYLYENYSNILVYFKNKLTFYGPLKGAIELYSKNSDTKGWYSGGGESGYIGISDLKTNEQTQSLLADIEIETKPEIFSYHVFQFPFKWADHDKNSKKWDFDCFKNELTNKGKWEKDEIKIQSTILYNEFNYFYDFVRDVLYDMEDDKGKIPFHHLEYDIGEKPCFYRVKIKGRDTYRLRIDSILLDIYDLNIGILSFHLVNEVKSQSSPDDILYINQYGRRIFPPFMGIPSEEAGMQSSFNKESVEEFQKAVAGTQKAELAEKIELDLGKGKDNPQCDFSDYYVSEGDHTCGKVNIDGSIEMPGFISDLICQKGGPIISHIIDDRMFTLCWYGNNDLANRLSSNYGKDSEIQNDGDNWWFKYVFVDGGGISLQNKTKRKEVIRNQTNYRWVDYQTFYGVSRYSFVCLSNNLKTLRAYESAFVLTHLQTIYYQMTRLVLIQQAGILYFSNEIAEISQLDTNDQMLSRIHDIRKKFIRFVNKMYFRKVTAQDQGIELYKLLKDQLEIDEEVEKLKSEFDQLHNIALITYEDRQNDINNRLTLIATFFLPATLIVSLFGMNLKGSWNFEGLTSQPFEPFWLVVAIGYIPSYLLLIYMTRKNMVSLGKLQNSERKFRSLIFNPWQISVIMLILGIMSVIFIIRSI